MACGFSCVFFACALKFKERACAKNAESHISRNYISTWEFVKSSTKKYTNNCGTPKMAVCTNNCGTE